MSTDFITQKTAKAHKKCSFSSKKKFVILVGDLIIIKMIQNVYLKKKIGRIRTFLKIGYLTILKTVAPIHKTNQMWVAVV